MPETTSYRMLEPEKQAPPSRRYLTAFAILVAVTIGFCGFTYAVLSPLAQFSGSQHISKSLSSILREVESSSRTANFEEHAQYKSLDHKFDMLWDEMLLPANGGYVTSSKTKNNTDKLGISMFHQLHCLSMIRDEMQLLKDEFDAMKRGDHAKGGHKQDVQVHRRHGHMHGDDGVAPGEHGHALHCFDYLRQTLLCHADGTVEKPKVDDEGKPYINGGGDRKCKNWELLYNAATDSDDTPFFTDDLR